jgi:hypothetical protein
LGSQLLLPLPKLGLQVLSRFGMVFLKLLGCQCLTE